MSNCLNPELHHPSSTVCSGQNIFENIQNLKIHFSPKGLDEIFKFQLQTFVLRKEGLNQKIALHKKVLEFHFVANSTLKK